MSKENILLAILLAFGLAVLASCNPTAKLQRKQALAVQTVLASRPLVDIVGNVWAGFNPCANDTTLMLLPGDTTVLRDTIIETVHQVDTDTQIEYRTRTIKETRTVHDTVLKFVTDTRLLRIVQDENKLKNDSLNIVNSRVQDLESRQKGKILIPWWWLVISLLGAGAYITKRLHVW